jgi:hypothetical protein
MKTPSLIEDGHTLDLTPWWRRCLQKLLPFKRRKVVALEDVLPLLDALESVEAQGRPHSRVCGCELCETWDQVHYAYTKFIFKHPLP